MLGPTADVGHDRALEKKLVLDAWSNVPSVEALVTMWGCGDQKRVGALMLMMLGHAGPVWGLEKVLLTLGPSRATSRN